MNAELQRQHQAFKQARERINSAALKTEAQRVSMGPARAAVRPFSPFIPAKPLFQKPPRRDWLYVASIETFEPVITVKKIQNEVCVHFDLSLEMLLSHRRSPKVVIPKHISIYLCRNFTPKSFQELARLHNMTDHTSALFAVRKIESLLGTDREVSEHVSSLKSKLEAMRDV